MSFILDALKKSETDRQQQSGAEFAGVPTSPQAQSVPRWLWIVGLLLAINLVVLIGLLLGPDPVAPPTSQVAAESTAISPPAPDQSTSSFEEQIAIAQQNPPQLQLELADVEPENGAEEFVKPTLISQDPSSVSASELYPTIQEVLASGSMSLPALHLDIHVFSPDPNDRFVFVNMSKLREGSQLSEGPVVAEITPEGVVLRHQGQHFLLPRD